jgi:hypothetical protein
MGQGALLLLVAAVTSLAAGLGLRGRGARSGLRGAMLQTLELVGIATLFLLGNLALGLVIVLAVRTVSRHFVSVYLLNDSALVALSALQGAVFFCWRRRRAD